MPNDSSHRHGSVRSPSHSEVSGFWNLPESFFRSVIEHSPEFLLVLAEDGAIGYASPSARTMLGIHPQEGIRWEIDPFVHPDDLPALRERIRERERWSEAGDTEHFRVRNAAGEWRVLEASVRPFTAAGSMYLVVSSRDVTERRRAEDKLRESALRDPLTHLPNRALFLERLQRATESARCDGDFVFAVLFLDLDRFKIINDSLGHTAGDELLRAVARRLQSCLRPADVVARFGGDEFAILLEGVPHITHATQIADRIQSAISSPVDLNGYEVFTSASIGIALSTSGADSAEHLLRSADVAMYRAKELGQARYEIFDRAMHAEALQRLQIETDLRRAMDRNEMRLFYQPIMKLSTGAVQSFEALLRWEHPERGLTSPAEFVPVAEETGLILPLGRWVLEEASQMLCRLQASGVPLGNEISMGVNLSARQLSQPGFARQLECILHEAGLDPAFLRLEVTESAVLDNSASAIEVLHHLKSLGFTLHMDDFGTGYSSLGYLHRLPFDAIKIDRSFVSRMQVDLRADQVVRTILAMARSMGLEVIAEGVETPTQLQRLRDYGCEYAQGFLFSPPVPENRIHPLLSGGATYRNPPAL